MLYIISGIFEFLNKFQDLKALISKFITKTYLSFDNERCKCRCLCLQQTDIILDAFYISHNHTVYNLVWNYFA